MVLNKGWSFARAADVLGTASIGGAFVRHGFDCQHVDLVV